MERDLRYPHARKTGLIWRSLGDELIVYDLDRHQAHCLNVTAAAIWRRCDGKTAAADIASSLEGELGGTVDEALVSAAIDSLESKHLLERPAAGRGERAGLSRRDLVRRAGLTAAVIAPPLVMTLLVPTSARAASCLGTGVACGSGAQCCSGLCVTGQCV
jgi:hypothetical protein